MVLKKNPTLIGSAIFRMCGPTGPSVKECDFIRSEDQGLSGVMVGIGIRVANPARRIEGRNAKTFNNQEAVVQSSSILFFGAEPQPTPCQVDSGLRGVGIPSARGSFRD